MSAASITCPEGVMPQSATRRATRRARSQRDTSPLSSSSFEKEEEMPPVLPRPVFLTPGATVPGTPYVVVRLLGRGGMGEIYEVEHALIGLRCALKILRRDHCLRADLVERMRLEACSLARIEHPNLVRVFGFGVTDDERPYFVMELLQGRDLRVELERAGHLPVPRALELVAQALDGLVAVHDKGLVHRDIKLENLFLCDSGTLKVVDFGIAKALTQGASITQPGMILGTPRSMAPEQCVLSELDARTDIYAVGLSLYELIAGRGPFDEFEGNIDLLRNAHCIHPIPPLSRFAPQPVPAGVEAVILRALAKAPDDRFQSAAEMAAALRSLIEEPPSMPPPAAGMSARPPLPPWPRPRNASDRAWTPLAISAVAAALFVLGLAAGHRAPERDARDVARTALAAAQAEGR